MKALMPLAEGFEEIETVTTLDVLRRAGIRVVTAGLPGTMLIGSRGLNIKTDVKFADVRSDDFDALVLVVGKTGYKKLGKSSNLMNAILDFDSKKKTIAAICAAPSLLAMAGILGDTRATICPGMERDIPRPRNDKVIMDHNIITSQGPGTAMDFALKIVEVMKGSQQVARLRRELVC